MSGFFNNVLFEFLDKKANFVQSDSSPANESSLRFTYPVSARGS